MSDKYFLNSLAKGMEVLRIISESSTALSLSEISEKASINTVRCTRICRTFEHDGFIFKDKQKKYHASPKMLSFGYNFIKKAKWLDVALYYMNCINAELKGISSLSILDGQDIVYLARVSTLEFLPIDINVGTKVPAYCTCMGKLLIAMSPPEIMHSIVDKINFQPLTPFTITNKDDFIAELTKIKKQGYAINDEELAIGNRAVAAPVVDEKGYAVAAVHTAFQTITCTRERLEKEVALQVIECAKSISDDVLKLSSVLNMSIECLVRGHNSLD